MPRKRAFKMENEIVIIAIKGRLDGATAPIAYKFVKKG